MISNSMVKLVQGSSAIRAMFEEGKRLAAIYGEENVFDYSLGNPSVAPPSAIKEAIIHIVNNENENIVHGYMNNSGYEDVRKVIADSLNKRFQVHFNEANILMTVGAAGGLNVMFKTLLNPEDEVIVIAPYFAEYGNYVANYSGKLVVVTPDYENFQINMKELKEKITAKTKALIINNPNNPTGVVYSENTIKELAEILREKQAEFQTSIYLISDEPYRELVYENAVVPYLPKYYENTIVGYSFSKSLSLPGERIGYLVMPNTLDGFEEIIAAANVANRILGYVNAPSLFQRVVARCIDEEVDLEVYKKNRDLLYGKLTEYGYQCIKPEGAFYLFVQALEEDEKAFCEKAKKHNLLLVPGSAFACKGYFRIAYCVPYERIERSLPAFEKLAKEYV